MVKFRFLLYWLYNLNLTQFALIYCLFYSVSTIYLVIKDYCKRLFYINEMQEAIIAIMHMLSLMYSIQLNEKLCT